MTDHVARAMQLVHPFAKPVQLEADLAHAVEYSAMLGPSAYYLASDRLQHLRRLARASEKADRHLLSLRHTQHVKGMRPLFTAFVESGLRWPDRGHPKRLVSGFEIVEDVPSSGLFRPIEEPPPTPLDSESNEAYINALLQDLRIHPEAERIFAETVKEQQLGLASQFLSKHDLDAMFGVGQWRPIPRHIILQHGKWRPIDDAKVSLHNSGTRMFETIVNQRPDFLAVTSKYYFQVLTQFLNGKPLPPWFHLVAGTEDLWKGYRQFFAILKHMRFSIVTFVTPQGVRVFVIMWGLPFGLKSAVVQFNRNPQVVTAVARRVLLLMMGHYFDDSTMLALLQQAPHMKTLWIRLFNLFQLDIGHDKRQLFRSIPKFLGLMTDLSLIPSRFQVAIFPACHSIEKAIVIIDSSLHAMCLTSGTASKLRGILTWDDSALMGKPCRGASIPLIQRQYFDVDSTIEPDSALHMSLVFLRKVLRLLRPRIVQMDAPRPPLIIYTDASTDAPCPSGLRLGLVIFEQDPDIVPICNSFDVPLEVVDSWKSRATYITQAELLILPVLTHLPHYRPLLANRDLIWFIDNQAALGAAYKAGSSVSDMSELTLLQSLSVVSLCCRAWYEYVPSKCNISDPLSRLGFLDPAVQELLQSGKWRVIDDTPDWQLFVDRMEAATFLLEQISAFTIGDT